MLINSDCLAAMATLTQNSIDTIITDPPYGLTFMGKDWDKGVPGKAFWLEMLRVAKPGSMLLAFGGTRTFHRMTVAIEDAGWEIRDCMMWLYGSGFPKSHNLKGEFEGWGTALKPAWEPIIVAMKPLDGTFAQNAEKYGVAGLNIDGSRIGTETITTQAKKGMHGAGSAQKMRDLGFRPYEVDNRDCPESTHLGRWPANLILDEACAELLDEQTGDLGNNYRASKANGKSSIFGSGESAPCVSTSDSGGASRFFHVTKWSEEEATRFYYCAKASKSERNEGCEDLPKFESYTEDTATPQRDKRKQTMCANNHPTVKPLKLMEYLCTLTKTPTGGIVLDPFMGSGTTGVACRNTGREFIGIEKEEAYFKIAQARIESAKAA